ncbi:MULTISPECIES: hypothetical protein [unclassified Novosphingobium]|uniref:hypothetical protein n=1 Tax=unclassified Novosphingobium TaxID=2644732 RepID=UPI00135BEB2D|nr:MULTISPECIES: hypothetical protein [unclassified Novosphingobium]
MRFLYLEPAKDWIDQSVAERMRLCAEALYAHHLISLRHFNRITSSISQTAARQLDLRSRNRRRTFECRRCDDTGYVDHAGFAQEPCDHKVGP